ncbi:MAG: SMI1/KNR4 family protein [Byssovorax sp.]
MPTTHRQPKPYCWVFRLGKNAKAGKKRVPAAFTGACCYMVRPEHEALLDPLRDLPEPDVSDADADITFAAIDDFIDRCELRPEVYTDDEIDADEERSEQQGFHAGASFDEAVAALRKGGLVVSRMRDPLAIPPDVPTDAERLDESVADLFRHLDLTSLDRVLGAIDERQKDLPRHASSAEYLVQHAFDHTDPAAFSARVRAAAPGEHPEIVDTLLLLAGNLAQRHTWPAFATFIAGLPAATDPRVAKKLAGWGLKSGQIAAPAPAKAPSAEGHKKQPKAKKGKPSVAERIEAIARAAKKAGVTLPKGASEEALAKAEKALGVKLPEDMRAFYRAHDGGPAGEGVCSGRELLSLQGIVRQWKIWKKLFDQGEFEENDEDVEADEGVQETWWIPAWIPVTYDFSGNHDVLDMAPGKGGKAGQIVSMWHDDPGRTLEGDDFLSWLEGQTWGKS